MKLTVLYGRALVLNEGARHFLLLTYAEERAHLGEAAIFLEIVWNGRGPQDTAVTIPWFPQQISSMGILQRAGLLDSCTLSHRCDIAVDGSYLGGPATALRHGSFVQIEVYPCSPAISDEEEERPQALPAILTPSMSTPTSSDSTSDLASTSGTSEHAGPDDYTSVIHLFRPASHGRPTHISCPYTTRHKIMAHFCVLCLAKTSLWPLAVCRCASLPVWWLSTAGWSHFQSGHCSTWSSVSIARHPSGRYPLERLLLFPGNHFAQVCDHWSCSGGFWPCTLLWGRPGTLSDVPQWRSMVGDRTANSGPWWLYSGGTPYGSYGWVCRTRRTSVQSRWWFTSVAIHWPGRHSPLAWGLISGGFYTSWALSRPSSVHYHRPILDCNGVVDVHWHLLAAGIFVFPRKDTYHLVLFGWFHGAIGFQGHLRDVVQVGSLRFCRSYFYPNIAMAALVYNFDLMTHRNGHLILWFTTGCISPAACQCPMPTLNLIWPFRIPGMGSLHQETLGKISFLSGHAWLSKDESCCPFWNFVVAFIWLLLLPDLPLDLQARQWSRPLSAPYLPLRTDQFPHLLGRWNSHRISQMVGLYPGQMSLQWLDPHPLYRAILTVQTEILTTYLPIGTLTVDKFVIADTPTILRDILTRPNGDISQATQLAIYTDGSRGDLCGPDQPAATTWAIVIVGYIQDCWHIIDWYGDFLELDPLALRWTGAVKDTILEGELCALQYAYLWILQMESNVDAPVFSDSMLALNMSTGRFTYQLDDDLALRTRAVHHFLQTCMYKTGRHAVSHVRAHRGNLGNELADFLANQIRSSQLQPRLPPRHYASWFHGNPAKILRAGLVMDHVIRPIELPEIHDDYLVFPPAEKSTAVPEWLPSVSQAKPVPAETTATLSCATFNVHTLRTKGATAYLRDQLITKQIFLIGLQETRSTFEESFDSHGFLRFGAPAMKGNGGTDLWLSRKIPYAFIRGAPCFVRRDDVQVLHAEPEILIAELNMGSSAIVCCVAHAPHKGYPAEDIQSWWRTLRRRILDLRRGRTPLVCIDANASVGESQPHFGHVAEQEWDVAGKEMLAFCQDLDLVAPATHPTWHSGTSQTWTSAKSSTLGSRNDYILLDSRWQDRCQASWVDDFLDAGHRMVDHSAAILSLTMPDGIRVKQGYTCGWDRNKILEATPDDWQRFYADWPTIPWTADVTEHAREIEIFLQQRLTEFFPKERKKKRNSVFSDVTWTLYRGKMQAKVMLTQCKKTQEQWQLAMGWAILTKRSMAPARLRSLLNIMRTCYRLQHYQEHGRRLHDHILQDRADLAEQLLEPLHRCPGKQAVRLLKPLRLGTRHSTIGRKSLPMIRNEDGHVVRSRTEAVDRWRRHFSQIEGGVTTSPSSCGEMLKIVEIQLIVHPSVQQTSPLFMNWNTTWEGRPWARPVVLTTSQESCFTLLALFWPNISGLWWWRCRHGCKSRFSTREANWSLFSRVKDLPWNARATEPFWCPHH